MPRPAYLPLQCLIAGCLICRVLPAFRAIHTNLPACQCLRTCVEPPAHPCTMPGKASLCFYHLQNEEGETAGRPNAYRLPIAPGKAPTLQDVHESFPLHGLGTFHFRFRVPVGDSHAYLDVLEPDQEVPTLGGNVHAKVLRLGECW